MQARLDLLPQSARQLLAQLALVGERCWAGLAAVLAAQNDLETLLKENLLVLEAHTALPGETEYRFQSDLLRSAALLMVPLSERPKTHQHIANWLASRSLVEEAKVADIEALTAHHFRQAGNEEAAYPYLLNAALAAAERGAYDVFETLLALDLPPHLRAQSALAYVQFVWRDDARAALQKLEEVGAWLASEPGGDHGALRTQYEEALRALQAEARTDASGLRLAS